MPNLRFFRSLNLRKDTDILKMISRKKSRWMSNRPFAVNDNGSTRPKKLEHNIKTIRIMFALFIERAIAPINIIDISAVIIVMFIRSIVDF